MKPTAIIPGRRNHLLWKVPALVQSPNEMRREPKIRKGLPRVRGMDNSTITDKRKNVPSHPT
jgi:hypothetical protein